MYCEVSDIEANFKDLAFTNQTNVTIEDVESFILQADGLINTHIGAKYLVPITTGDMTLAMLKLFSVTLVSDRVKAILEVKQSTNNQANQDIRGTGLTTSKVLEMLKKIASGDMPLLDQTLIANNGQGLFYSNNYSNNVTPQFKKDVESW